MLLGELIDKCDFLEKNIKVYFSSVSKGEVEGENVNALIKGSSDDIERYYNYYYTILNVSNSIKVELREGKETTLGNVFIIRDTLNKKIEFLDKIIVDNNYNIVLTDLIAKKNDLIEDLFYINTIVSKTIWSTEVNVKGLGQI